MPNPVPLATKEEEERRAWVTAHHEVVRLVKDCFGDRFSNNEIFDRLKISRRTGYRALGNDERIGKAPGRKPKITDTTIREMIDYIEAGGCTDVGNVWKHLAEHFAPDCNPKTVQDAVKKSGFKNYRDSVKLEPLLAVHLTDGPTGTHIPLHTQHIANNHHPHMVQSDAATGGEGGIHGVDEVVDETQIQQLQHAGGRDTIGEGADHNDNHEMLSRQQQNHMQSDSGLHVDHTISSHHHFQNNNRRHHQQDPNDDQSQHHQSSNHQTHHLRQSHEDSNIDPSFHQHTPGISEALRSAIDASSDSLLRYTLSDVCQRFPEAAQLASSYLIYVPSQPPPGPAPPPPPSHTTPLPSDLGDPSNSQIHPALQMHSVGTSDATGLVVGAGVGIAGLTGPGKRSRIAVCRRCGRQYDRAENTMDNRSCLYHKGSPQRISPQTTGTILQNPEAFIWSCCGGNGNVRGCCRAMHTTKKKRSYGKKRDAATAGLDDDGPLGVNAHAGDIEGVHLHGDGEGEDNGLDESGLSIDPGSVDVGVDLDEPTMLSVAAAVQMQGHHNHHQHHHHQHHHQSNTHNDHDLMTQFHSHHDGGAAGPGPGHSAHPVLAVDDSNNNHIGDPTAVDAAGLQDLQLPAAAVQQMQSHAQHPHHPPRPHQHHQNYHSSPSSTADNAVAHAAKNGVSLGSSAEHSNNDVNDDDGDDVVANADDVEGLGLDVSVADIINEDVNGDGDDVLHVDINPNAEHNLHNPSHDLDGGNDEDHDINDGDGGGDNGNDDDNLMNHNDNHNVHDF